MNLRFWLTKTRIWLRNLLTARVRNHRRNRAFTQARSPFAEFLEPRLLLTGGHTGSTSDPGEFYYSLTGGNYVYDSDYSRTWADDSDIVKLTVEPDGSWQHEIFFDGSDVGLTTGEEDIDAFSIRDDGTILISTSGCVNVSGVSHAAGGDLLQFTPTSTGRHTAGTWEMYVDGNDVGISHWENIDAVSELPDGRLVISTKNNAKLNGINNVRSQDLSVLTLSRTGNHTRGTWQRYLDGSDIGLTSWAENIDAVSVSGDGSTIHLSSQGTAYVSGPRAYDEDVFTFEASHLGSHTSGSFRNKLTLNASHTGISSWNDIDAFHAAAADPTNPQSPVIEEIANKTIDELMELSFTPTATDPDTPVGDLEWSLTSGPSAATVNAETGRFSWTPTESDGPGSFDVTLTVSDGGRSDSETFTVTVAEVNTAPELSAIGNQIVNEGATVSFDADATDIDLPANALTYSISGDVPTGSTFDAATGQFSWDTTMAHGGDLYDVTVTVSDGQLSDSESFTIAVNNVGGGLTVEPIDDQSIDELVPFSYQVVATGSSSDGLLNLDFETAADGATLSSGDVIAEQFAAMGIHITSHDPANHPPMIFDSSNPTGGDRDLGTPNSRFGGPGIGNGGKSGRWKNDVARENILIISEDGDSQDPDDRARGGRLILTFDTPTAIDDIGLLDVDSGRNTIYLYDADGHRISKVNIPRRGNNSHQVLALNAEGVSRLELVLCGSGAITDLIFDRDGTPPTGGGPLTYALAPDAPAGMTISETGLIEWTPTEAQGPGAYGVTVEVSDGATTVTETFTVTVGEVNLAPVVDPIDTQTVDELSPFSYQVVASDSDLPANTLTYSLATGAPSGMTISGTGLIEWTPTEDQGPDVYPITVEVSDGTVTTTEGFQITVNEVNAAPVITPISDQTIDELVDFSYQVVANDSDLPANTLTYSLATDAPTGMSISATGLITWTPTEAQGPGVFDVTVEVSDGTVTSTEPFQITVGEVNVAPVITPIDDQTIDEQSLFSLPVQVTDVDLPTNTLDFSLASGAPAGMSISDAGLITWTPTEEQGPDDYPVTVEVSDGSVTVTESFVLSVAEVNVAPVLAEIANQNADEETEFSLQTVATDSDIPANTLTYSLIGTPPAGMAIDNNGLLTWTPTETQGPGTYAITVEVSDGELTDSKTFEIEVAEVNLPPVIEEIDDIAFNEHSAWTLLVEASDPDLPENGLTYDLIGTVPAGIGIDADGLISWTPTEAQGPASYTVNVEVSDGSLTDVETFNIMVNELNQDPVLAPIGNQTVTGGETLTFSASAIDDDIPANTLTYAISGDVPATATFDSQTGQFAWNSTAADAPATLNVTVTVDDGAGGSDSETFTISVAESAVPSITLVEDDRFQTTATQAITVPADASYFEFEILNLSFDTDATGSISDAFEVALLDADGNSLVHTIAADRDAYFNTSEPGTEAAAANTIVNGAIVQVDLSHIPAGTAATVVYRLVNNDNADGNDTATTVTVSEGTVITGDLNTSAGAAAFQQDEATGPVDLTTLTDVTGSFGIEYAQTSFNDDTSTLFADVWLTNNANQPIDGPFIVVIENLTDPLVAATDFDGRTSDGNPYYIVEDLSDSGSIQPGATTLAQTLSFINPNNTPFDYKLAVLAAPNEAPEFTSTPVTLVEAGRPYSYDSNADDPDGDTLTYELLAGPEGMTIDSATGVITWSPETGDEGNHSVVIKASDGRGAFDEQQFTVEVRDLVPNRPPVIISSPVTQTTLFGATPQINIPTTIGVWNATRAGIDLNYDTGTELEDLRDDLAASFPNGTLIGTSRLDEEFLSGIDVLALHATASGFTEVTPLTAAEQTALFNFVSNGGSAILLAENDGNFAAFSDSILAPFGMDTSGVINGVTRADVTAPVHPIFDGPFGKVTGFDTWFPSQIVNFGAYANSVAALSGNRSVGAVIEPGAIAKGSGGVVVFSDTISGYPGKEGDQPERTRLFKNSLAWLGGSNLTREVTRVTISEYVELTPADVGSTSTTNFSTLPSDDASAFGAAFANAQSVNFDVDPFGNPIPSGSFITTQYESLGLVMNNFQVSNSVYGGPASAPNTTTTPAVPGETLEFQFVVPVVAVGFINTSPDQDEIEFLDSEGEIIFSTRDQNAEVGPDFDTDRFVGAVADPSRPIHAVRVINADPNGSGRLELDELLFVPAQATYEYQVEALDPDFDPIRYQLDEAPSGMIVNAATGLISWAPGSDDVGTHTVRVTAADGRGGTATQEYQLAVLADPTNTAPVIITDPVDSFFIPGFSNPASGNVTPQRISLDLGNGETFDGTVSITLPDQAGRFADIVISVDESISMGGDQDWIPGMIPLLDQALQDAGIGDTTENPNRFAIVGGGRQNLVSYFFSQQPNTQYTLYGPNNEVVAEGVIDEVLPDELLNLQFQDDGRYVLVVEAANPADLAAGIDIGVEGDVGEAVRAESLQLNTLISDEFLLPGQPVQYGFSLGADTLLYFDSQTKDVYSYINWSLEGPTGALASNIRFLNSDTADSTPTYSAVAGDYTLTIDAQYDTSSDFKFQLLDLAASTQIDSGETIADEFETKVGTKAYRFNATKGQLFSFENSTPAVHPGSKWRLFSETGEVLVSKTIGTNQSPMELPYSGQYFLLMEAALWPNEGSAQLRQPSTFEFTAEFVDAAPPTPFTLGETVNGNIDFVGDFVEYSFSLTERSSLYFDSLVDNTMTWQLSGPAGTMAAKSFRGSDSFNNETPVLDLVAGSYTLRVNSNSLEGPFAYRLLDLADAANITPGVEFSGELTVPNETDLYRFNAAAGDRFYVDVVAASDVGNTLYRIVDQYGREIVEVRSLSDAPEVTIPTDGEYTLLVEGWRANADQDTYTLNVVPVVETTQALTLGSVTGGSLPTPGARVVYTFNLSTDTQLYFDSLTNDQNIVWSLEGPRGDEVSSLRFDRSDSTDRIDASIDAIAGDWRLTVQAVGDATGDFSFVLLDMLNPTHTTPIAPNPGSANPNVTITPTSGLAANQTEVFRFDAAPGDEFSFVTSVAGSVQSYYRVLDENGTEVVPRTFLSTDQLNETLTLGGTYLLLVEGRYNDTDVDDWSIDINYIQNNGATTFSGTPLTLGTTTSGDLSTASQVDAYTFTLSDRSIAYFDSLTDSGVVRWNLTGPTGVVVNNRGFNASDSFNLADVGLDLIAGDYLLEVFASSGTPGAYSFRLHDVADATPITPGTAFSNTLDPANETHLYKFDANAGENLYFDVEAASDLGNTQYKLLDPFGRRIFTSNGLRTFGLQQLNLTGSYTLLVEGWRGNTGVDTYTMNVHHVPDAVPTPLAFGDVNTGSLTTPGEVAQFTFSLNDRTQVHFDSLTNSGVYLWTLNDSTGTVVNARRFNASDASNGTVNVIELVPDDYTLTVSGIAETQDFAFRLLDVAADSTAISTDTQITSVHVDTKSTNIFDLDFQAGDRVFFESISTTGFSANGRWRLFDSFGNEIFDQATVTDVGPLTMERSGNYRLIVEGAYYDTGVNGEVQFEVVSLDNVLAPSPPTPLTPGEVINGDISKRYETDHYAFSTSEDTLGYFDSLTHDSQVNWTLRNDFGTLVTSRTFNSSTSSLLPLPAGNYELTITSSTIRPYSFSFRDLATATTIVPETPQTGELSIANETDLFQFSASEGDQFFLDVVSVDSANRASISVINELGVEITSSTSLADQDTFTIPADGQYFILVDGKINQTVATGYQIDLVPTGTVDASLSLGLTQSDSIATVGQSFEYSFNLPNEASLYFDSLTDSGSIQWSLTGASGTVVTNRRFNASDSFNFQTPVLKSLAAGDYTLTVTGVGDAVGNFSFRLIDIASGTPIAANTPVSGELTVPNETDVYRFDGTTGDQLLVDWIAADDTNNSLYRVFDPYGNEVFEYPDLLDRELPALPFTGTYTLLVEGWRGNTGLDTYQFNLVPAVNRTVAMNIGDTITETLSIGETIDFTFNAADDIFVHFDSLTNESNLMWSLTGPAGQIVSNRQFSRSDSQELTDSVFELRQGDYRLMVDGTTDFTGDFSFRLIDVATATAIAPGVLSGELDPGIESQLYKFDANAGDDFSFDSLAAGNGSATYRLVDPFGKTLFTRTVTLDQNNVQLESSGTYTLLVEGRFNATSSNAYQIGVIFNGNTPPPALTGSALTLGIPQTGDLNTTGQSDSYQFSLSDRSLLHMDVLTNNSTFRWSLRGPGGAEVTNRAFTSTDSLDSSTSNLDLPAGDYQLDIFASSGTPGVYSFTLHDFADAVSITPGTEFSGEFTNPAETDLYQFFASQGDRFLIDVVATNDLFSKEFKLIDQYGVVVATFNNSLRDVDQIVAPNGGTYTLLVEGRRNNTGTDTYTLNVVPIASTAFTLTTGASSNNTLPIGGEQRYTFSLVDPALLLFTPQTNTNRLKWTLSSADGTFVDSREFDDGILPVDLPAGNYVLAVDGIDDYTGDAAFTAVTADSSSQLAFDQIANAQLTTSSSIAVYKFNGVAGQHFALRPDFNLVFDDAATSAITADDLTTGADNEDQHSGIDVALRNDVFRDGAAINFITVSDEDRDILDDNVNFETIFTDLTGRGALLNAIVSSPFRDENNATAIGVDSAGNAYLPDGTGGFTISPGGFATTNNISIQQDYIDLAWALDGAAWDLGRLRVGGVTAESFTNAFVDVKVSEILEQTSLRLSASDPNADLTFVDPVTGVYDNIVGGQKYDFDIQIGNDGNPRSFDLLFTQGQTVGSIPVYIVAPYGYNAAAYDADGDTLTWSITEGPEGLVVDPATGMLAWPADSVVYGQHTVTLRVEDGRGGFDEQTFDLDVNGGEAASISGVKFHDENEDGQFQALVDVIVPGDADPYLAGMPDGSTASGSDVAPDQSPIFVEDLELVPGTVLTFAAAGQVSFAGAPNVNETPDGKLSGYGSHAAGAENGISNITSNWNSLVGIFLSDDQPDSNPAPASLDFINATGVPGGINYTSLAPELQQVFFIGDGVTDDGTIQEITVPEGATRLFLGTHDGTGWYNNAGEFFVTISGPQEPTIPDWTIYLDQNRNGIRDEGERSTTTDASGTYTFDNLQPGSYVVAEELQPGWAQTAPGTGTFEITVASGETATGLNFGNKQVPLVNSDPLITSTPLQTVVAREDYRYQPTITELDGDDLAFDLPLGPAGMAVNSDNGTISWTPRLDQIGPQNVLLRVRDGRGGFDLQYFTINVQKPNTAPVITSTPPAGPAGVGLPFTYNADAVDADDDTLTWSLTMAPEGATIDPATGVINWTPASDQQGAQSFEVTVDDGRGLTATQTFDMNVQVDPPNAAPTITSQPPLEAHLGNTYLYRAIATDDNGDPLTISLATAPAGMTIDADGLVAWTPTPSQIGDNAVSISVDDGRGGVVIQDYVINVATQPVNQAPQITSPPKTSAVAGQTYTFQPTAVDPNNDTLVWELVTGPVGMSINPSTGELTWNPTIDDIGNEQVAIRVLDTSAAYSELGYTLNVRAVNTPPVIGSTPLTSAAVGATYFYGVQATDADGDLLTYSLSSAPAGMAIDPATGVIVWTPVAGQEGTNAVVVSVTDGNGGNVSQTFDVVTAAGVNNLPPTITSTPGFFASVDELYSYDTDATDPESAALTYELLQSPTGMTIDANSGLVEWTPAAGDLGTTIVRIVARDPAGAGSIQEFSLTVLPANTVPVINSTPPATVPSGGVYRYDVLATDADGEFLTYELTTAPAGMLIDGVGRIFWVPTDGQVGSNSVELLVRDPRGAVATQAFDIEVEVDTADPQVAVLLSTNPVNIGDSVDIRVSAIDNVGVESLSLMLDGVPVPLDANGMARVPMTSVGSFVAEATATDAAGNSATDSITIFVADPNDLEGPVLSITSPSDGGIVGSLADIVGTVTDDTLVEYRILIAEFGTTNFQQIATGDTNVTDDVLGQLDPTLLANGTYVLRLEAEDAGGRFNVIQQTVEVASENKLGNFRLGFTDLVVPVNGIDVVLSRTYDSLNSTVDSDFGFGWRMDFRDVQLQVSVEEASDFDKQFGFYTPYRDGTRVYITLPGGERQGFTFTPVAKGVLGLVYFNPRFTPDDGVTSTLTVSNANLSNNFGDYYAFAGGQPYNPAAFEFGGAFTLTTKEGLVYRINAETGQVTRISDPNGNRLDFSDAGVTSNSGVSVTFERDAAGRITAAVDPDGDRIQYDYNAAGDLIGVTDRNGNTSTYKYESPRAHYLTEVVDPLGNTGIRGEYDDDGRLISLTDAGGNGLDITTNLDNNTQVIVDELGNQTIYQYDDRGNTTSETNALGHITASTFDSNNNKLTETDPLGRVTTYTYDSFDNILTITDPAGAVTTFTYADARRGLVRTISDPLGNTTTYKYDTAGNLLSFDDGTTQVASSEYDNKGNLTSYDDPATGRTVYSYDAAGHLLTSTAPSGLTTTFSYDADGRLTGTSRTQTVNGILQTLTEQVAYDENGNLIEEVDAAGHTTTFAYDANDRLIAETDALGRTTRFVYDSQGLLVETIFPDSTPADLTDNPRRQFGYDQLGRQVSETDELGRTTHTVYDAIGQVVAQIFPDSTLADLTDNPRIQSEYDAAGQLTAVIDENGNRTEFEYDQAGNRIRTRDALGTESTFGFDSQRRQILAKDALGQETRFSYDDAGRITQTLFADGTTTQIVYDESGLLTAQIDQNGNTTSFSYDVAGRLKEVVEANGSVTTYGYDEAGNLTTLTDAAGRTTEYHYDALSRRVSVERPLGETDLTGFDAVGNRIAYTDFNGERHTFEYDERDRLVAKNIVGDPTVTYSWLANGLPATILDARGTTNYSYDERDRLVSQTDPDGSILSYSYDGVGNTTSVSTQAGTTTYSFDVVNRIQSVTDVNDETTAFTYDAIGRPIQTSFANGVVETKTYNTVNRLVSIESSLSDTVFDSLTYTFDAKGNRLSVTEFDGRKVEYTYDAVDRLLSESTFNAGSTAADRVTSFTYDAVSNRLTHNDTIDGLTTYIYDVNDHLLTEVADGTTTTYSYDLNGNRISKSDGTTTARYDYSGQNHLLGVDTDGDGTADVSYQYDASGNRVSRTEAGTTIFYQVDSNREHAQTLTEYTLGDGVAASYTYVGDRLIAQHQTAGTTFYHTDSLGSTRLLTDDSGNVLNTYTYDSFGTVIAETGSFENEFLFNGQRRDLTTGLDYLRARNYDTTTGRFTSVDPFDGSINSPVSLHNYVYAAANPINASDPTGRYTIAEVSFSSSTLADVQTDFQKNAFQGLKRVGRIADKLLVPGTLMQNVGAALMGSNSRRSLRAYEIYAAGTRVRAAGFQAIGIALSGIIVDTVNDVGSFGISWGADSTLGKVFGPVEWEVKLLSAKLTVGKGKNKKTLEAGPDIEGLIMQYINTQEGLLKRDSLAPFIAGKDPGPFESGVQTSIDLAQRIQKEINKITG